MKKNDSGQGRNRKTFYKSKKFEQKLFTLLLKCIENDMYQSQIAKYLSKKFGQNISKQRVNHWLKLLLEQDLIRKDRKKPILTEQGKKFLIHGENSPNYKGHALEVSYTLKSIGDLPANNVKLKNWGYWKDRFFDVFIRVNRGKVNKLMVYVPEVKSNTKHDLLIKLGEKLGMIISLIERQYRCEIDHDTREITRRLEVHAPNDPEGKVFESEEINYKGKTIDINQSGHAHFDVTEGDNTLEPFEAIERYDQMIHDFPSIKNMMGKMVIDQKSILNLFAMNMENMKISTKILESLKNAVLSTPKPEPSQVIAEAIESSENEDLTANTEELEHIRINDHVGSFVAEREGVLIDYPELNEGSRIWLPRKVAELLIRKGKAIRI